MNADEHGLGKREISPLFRFLVVSFCRDNFLLKLTRLSKLEDVQVVIRVDS